MTTKIALGGGCHWCTEAVFQSLIGVHKVEQGFVASTDENTSFSEAVIVHFSPEAISLQTLIEIGPKVVENPGDYKLASNFVWCATMALNGLIQKGVFELKNNDELLSDIVNYAGGYTSKVSQNNIQVLRITEEKNKI